MNQRECLLSPPDAVVESNDLSKDLTIEVDKTIVPTEEVEDGQIVPYWVPSLDIVIVQDMPDAFGRNAIPSAILQHLSFNEIGNYYPVIYHNGSSISESVVMKYLRFLSHDEASDRSEPICW